MGATNAPHKPSVCNGREETPRRPAQDEVTRHRYRPEQQGRVRRPCGSTRPSKRRTLAAGQIPPSRRNWTVQASAMMQGKQDDRLDDA